MELKEESWTRVIACWSSAVLVGRAANDDYLVVDRDGHAMQPTPKSTRRFELGPGAVEQLQRELEIKDW
jgi:hypothetical protein